MDRGTDQTESPNNNHEFDEGISRVGFVRDPNCVVPGCPGLEHMKVIAILSPVIANIYDSAGHHTGPLPDGSIDDGISSVTYLKVGHGTFIILPNDPSLRIQLTGTGSGTFTVNAADFNGTSKLEFEQYNNVAVTPSSRGSLGIGIVGTPLNWDLNGTGNPVTVAPTTVSTSAADDSTDTSPPSTSVVLKGTPGQPGYFRSAVDVGFLASDDLSGVAFTDYSLDGGTSWAGFAEVPLHFAQDGSYTLLYRSTDYAGNQETAKALNFVIDTVPPTVSITSPAVSLYTLGQAQAAAYSCSDAGSGISTCTGTVPRGANIDTTSVGQKTFSVMAVDRAGNQTVQSLGYGVSYGVCVLYDQSKSHHIGNTVPIKIMLCDANGNDVSSSAITVTATGLTEVSSQTPGPLVSDGSANPDNNFRFDSTLGSTGGYIFNLSTNGLTAGTYALSFTAPSDPASHNVQFEVQP